ncbi:hypothetical protein Agub_g6815 [Astrephomene gubernaculifera]|uniref:Ankyrin repeat domain-containing protein n=1 Tax=Astrephomene gubernaculifera TaxID=47775 RepID=A0AAD3DT73_9CHLO|nr:hypothetical protein Agub_g6815 [Astrephomene gubernaculifera]
MSRQQHRQAGIWPQLQPELAERIISFLSPNEVACTVRLINKAAAAQFSGPRYTTVKLSSPVPHHAFQRHWSRPGVTRSLTLKQREQLVCLTARSGSIPNLEAAVASTGLLSIASSYEAVLPAAAAAGQLEMCQWLQQRNCLEGSALEDAAGAGHRAICEWGLANGWDRDLNVKKAMCAAAQGGHVELMEWLLQQQLQQRPNGNLIPSDLVDLLEAAAQGCELAIVVELTQRLQGQLLLDKEDVNTCSIVAAAAGSPTPDWQAKVEWLEARGFPRSSYVANWAASCPEALDRLMWLRERGYPFTERAAEAAINNNRVEALEFLLDCDIEPDDGEDYNAASDGHLDILILLNEYGYEVGNFIGVAAQGGHLAVVVWLSELLGREALQKSRNMRAAVLSGNLELMGWLRERGCRWADDMYTVAAGSGCEEALEWLVEQGCPMQDDGVPCLVAALQNDVNMLRCLRRLGCPWGPHGWVFAKCIEDGGDTAVLRLLLDEGCPVDWLRVMEPAYQKASKGYHEAVQLWNWLCANGGSEWWQREGYAQVMGAMQFQQLLFE